MVEDELEGIPDYMKEILHKLPKREKPTKNKPCPCGSGKKYKLCCYPKSLLEIDEEALEKRRKEIIIDIQKRVKDDSYMILDVDKELICLSTGYGPYSTKEWALYFQKNNEKLEQKIFIDIFDKIQEFLTNISDIVIRTNTILDQDTQTEKEFEILFMAMKKEYVLDVLNKTDFPVQNTLDIYYAVCLDIAYRTYQYLLKKGIKIGYPHRIHDLDGEKKKVIEESSRDFGLELRSAQKLLYMTTIIKEIKEKCESPIEEEIGIRLAKENIPFVQQIGITDKFPDFSNGNLITKPDFLILDPFVPIAIYCDGHDFHEKTAEQATRDKRIDRDLQGKGFAVLRFTGTEIKNNLDRCIEEVKLHYLGKEFAKTPNYILQKRLAKIYPKILTEWESKFYQSMWDYFRNTKPVTIKQERIIKRLIDKTQRYFERNSE